MKKILRKIEPAIIKNIRVKFINQRYQARYKKLILDYYKDKIEGEDKEIDEVISYVKGNTAEVLPYDFKEKYELMKPSVNVYRESENQFPYIIHNAKKLYFPKKMNDKEVINYYISILTEQDVNSPHRYIEEGFDLSQIKIVADVGCAEGIFSLELVEMVDEIHIFEVDDNWIEALKLTFKPFGDKVKFINKFVSDNNNELSLSLDTYFKEKRVDLLKVDVEGMERKVLNGSKAMFEKGSIKHALVCTYHLEDDYQILKDILEEFNFEVNHSYGYMIFYGFNNLKEPYIRRGLIRAKLMEG